MKETRYYYCEDEDRVATLDVLHVSVRDYKSYQLRVEIIVEHEQHRFTSFGRDFFPTDEKDAMGTLSKFGAAWTECESYIDACMAVVYR